MNEVNVGCLREHVGVLSQQPNLFDADNIRYGASPTINNNRGISDTDIRKAAKAAFIR